MTKLVLTHRSRSRYDDEPGARYHFEGRAYLPTARRGVGDWCLYYEPQREGRASYVALAFIDDLTEDPQWPGYWYLRLRYHLEFPTPVHYRLGESRLVKSDGSQNRGLFGRSIREIVDAEFEAVVRLGLASVVGVRDDASEPFAVREPETEFIRPITEIVTRRPVRDRAFAQIIRRAYDSRCALTGVQLINGGGVAEAEAAHIKPVAANGPDAVQNGLSLSRTVHWLFDRGFVSLDDDYRVLKTREFPKSYERMLNPSGYARAPDDHLLQPHPAFLRWHRENVFKGL